MKFRCKVRINAEWYGHESLFEENAVYEIEELRSLCSPGGQHELMVEFKGMAALIPAYAMGHCFGGVHDD